MDYEKNIGIRFFWYKVFGFGLCAYGFIFFNDSNMENLGFYFLGVGLLFFYLGRKSKKKRLIIKAKARETEKLKIVKDKKLKEVRRREIAEKVKSLEQKARLEQKIQAKEKQELQAKEKQELEAEEEERQRERQIKEKKLRLAEKEHLKVVGSYIDDNVDQAIDKFEGKLQSINDGKINKKIQTQSKAQEEADRKIDLFKELREKLQKVCNMVEEKFPDTYSIKLDDSSLSFNISNKGVIIYSNEDFYIEPNIEKEGYFICTVYGDKIYTDPPYYDGPTYQGTDNEDLHREIEFKNEKEVVSFFLKTIEDDYTNKKDA